MARLIWTESVLRQLEEQADYVALENPAAARAIVQTVFNRVEQLKTFPESGRVPPEVPDSRYRELIIGTYRLFYRIDGDSVLLVYFMRAQRGFPAGMFR